MNFIILADKYIKGMKSKGGTGLVKVNSRFNLFETQHKIITKNFKNPKIIYVYGFDGKKISHFFDQRKYSNVIPIYNENYEKYNNTYSLSLAQKYIEKDFFILFGYSIFKKQIFENFNKSNSQIFLNNKTKNHIGCIVDNENVNHICFDINNYIMDIYYISKADAPLMKELCTTPRYKNYFIFELLNKMVDMGVCIKPTTKNYKNINIKISKDKETIK
jgi:CTP:phosphocholine cytidylyltransferase-like protein